MSSFTSADVDKHIKDLSRKQKKKWTAIANGVLQSFLESGVDEKTASVKAIRIANSRFEEKKPLTTSEKKEFNLVKFQIALPDGVSADQTDTLEKFVKECMSTGGEQEKCMSNAIAKLNVPKFEEKPIVEMEIFRIGTHNGDEFTENDLREIASNFHVLKDELRPKLKITHRDNQKTLAGLASYGDVVDVYIKKRDDGSNSLFAKLTNIPSEVVAFIKERRFPERSIELYPEFKLGTKEDAPTYKNVLKAIALLGHEMPAVSGMAPILMEECLECQGTVCKVQSFEIKKPQVVSKEMALSFEIMQKNLKALKDVA